MKFIISILIISSLLFFQYCKTTSYTPDDYPAGQIIFGSGGGFAGTYNHYYLFENGALYKNSTVDTSFQKVKKIKKNQTTQIFSNYEFLNLKDYSMDEPGNMTYYIHFKNKDINHKIQWGGTNEQVDKKVETMYGILMKLAGK
jgi:hypothetical protein